MTKKRVLVLTEPFDTTAYAVIAGLRILDVDVRIFMPSLIPFYKCHSFNLDDDYFSLSDGEVLLCSDLRYDSIWFRRTGGSTLALVNTAAEDLPILQMIHNSYNRSVQAFISAIHKSENCLKVNDYASKVVGDSKVLQLVLAKNLGFRVPKTLISNDPEQIKDFQARNSRPTICKPFAMHSWRANDKLWQSYSAIVPDVGSIDQDSLQIQPAIYQQYIDKLYEIRVVVFGGHAFSMKIASQEVESAKVDWRQSALLGVHCEVYALPKHIKEMCNSLLQLLGLSYGAFDFIRSPDGDYVFLEVNEAGQFLFLEEACPGLNMLDAFCFFLVNGNLNGWDSANVKLNLKEVERSKEFLDIKNEYASYLLPGHYLPAESDKSDTRLGALSRGTSNWFDA